VIDPWHLAAALESLHPRVESASSLMDRVAVLAAARHALDLHGWLASPDFEQEGEIKEGHGKNTLDEFTQAQWVRAGARARIFT
jgi:hypothetical protein